MADLQTMAYQAFDAYMERYFDKALELLDEPQPAARINRPKRTPAPKT